MLRWSALLAVAGAVVVLGGCAQGPGATRPLAGGLEQDSGDIARIDETAALPARGRVVVANRASGTISVIDTKSNQVVGTHNLPAELGEPDPEPMYVVHTATHNRVFVGDRANDRAAVFNARSFKVEGTVAAGRGVFHMWADPQGRQLWVNNDIDNTSTVIDPTTLAVIATVPTPADLVDLGGKPHDVILDSDGTYAYVTVLGVSGANDYVVQYDTATFQEMGRAAVGKDPHVSLARQSSWLYVPCQNSNVVIVLNRFTMAMETSLMVSGAHGAGMARNGRYFYTANLLGGGTDALFTIDTQTNTLVGQAADSPYPVPHNIALTPSGHRLYLTHSGGSSDKVTVYTITASDPVPTYLADVSVGLNPFGITYIP